MATFRRIVGAGPDMYPTPHWATRALLSRELFAGTILEPSCGKLDIVFILNEFGYRCEYQDAFDYGVGAPVKDIFDETRQFDNIITNPPYGDIFDDYLAKALDIAQDKVALFLPIRYLEGGLRYERTYVKNYLARIYVFVNRVTLYPLTDAKKENGTTTYGWFIFQRTRSPYDEPVIRFIHDTNPNKKSRNSANRRG